MRLLERLGAGRGRSYRAPATRAQASARIAQLLTAGRPEPQATAEAEAAG